MSPKPAEASCRPLPMRGPDVSVDRRDDGSIIIASRLPPGERPRSLPHLLDARAAQHPQRPWVRQRDAESGAWRTLTYGEAARRSREVAGDLGALGLGPEAALMVLSGNSIEQAVLQLAAMRIRAPVAPVSQAYALASADHSKLNACFSVVRPKAVFVQSHATFARALAALPLDGVTVISADPAPPEGVVAYADLGASGVDAMVETRMALIEDETAARYMFTSGSTGAPKAVVQTQGQICSQIASLRGLFLDQDEASPPETLEWMPWSHCSAGAIGFAKVLDEGGTVYLDDGKPLPGLFEQTIRNLYDVSPEAFGSAPVAFAMLADALEGDARLRSSFFRRLKFMSYGGATLSEDLHRRLETLAIAETGERIPFSTMYGATETLGVTAVNWISDRVGLIGLPLPGVTLKLVPRGERYEVRVKGPTVATRYLGDREVTAVAFDEEGYYRLGDAVRLVDEADVRKGLAFDGRVAEDFKLSTGTWVSVGALRAALVSACAPLVADAVIAGQDRPYAAALVWLSPAGQKQWAAAGGPAALSAELAARVGALNAGQSGSSRRIGRVLVLATPPSLDSGEITDKGYVNQAAALAVRAADVSRLYAERPGADILLPQNPDVRATP